MKKHLLKSLLALALVLITGNAWGEDNAVATFVSGDVITGSSYAAYSNDDWSLSKGGNNASCGFNKTNKTELGNVYGTAATASHHGYTIVSKNKLNKVYKMTFVFTGSSFNGSPKLYLGYSTDGSSWSAVPLKSGDGLSAQGVDAKTSNTTYTFEFSSEIESAYYAIVHSASQVLITSSHLFRFDGVTATFYEASAPSTQVLQSLAISGTPTKTEYKEGDKFDPAGLVVTGTYDDASTDDALASQATWSCTPETLTTGTTSVTVTATVDGITSEAYVVNGITVEAFVQTYANTYTSNVELTTVSGTSASGVKVVIDKTEYDAIKAGTGKVQGACVVTIPVETKTLHFHAAGWNGESVKLEVNGAEYTLTSDTGVSGNSPFILANDPETNDYFTFSPNGATTITFTATSGNRFVLFGVNAELYKSHDVTIASSGKSTLYLDYAATVPEGVKAYYATGYDSTNDIVTMTEVTDNTIAKNQGVMLMGTAGETYAFEETADVDAPATNYFGGSATGMNMDDKTGENGYYILQGGQFAPISDGDLPAYKAYLYLEDRPYTGQSSTIGFRFGDATQIENVNAVEADKYFDLMGREVLNPTNGIYILNGKKVLVK